MKNVYMIFGLMGLAALAGWGLTRALRIENQSRRAEVARHVILEIPTQEGDLKTILQKEAEKARQQNLKPFVEVTATWCGPCQRLLKCMDDPRMVDAFSGTYIIHLDHDFWKPQFESAGIVINGIPAFYRLDSDAHVTGVVTGAAWAEDIPENIAPPLKKFLND